MYGQTKYPYRDRLSACQLLKNNEKIKQKKEIPTNKSSSCSAVAKVKSLWKLSVDPRRNWKERIKFYFSCFFAEPLFLPLSLLSWSIVVGFPRKQNEWNVFLKPWCGNRIISQDISLPLFCVRLWSQKSWPLEALPIEERKEKHSNFP